LSGHNVVFVYNNGLNLSNTLVIEDGGVLGTGGELPTPIRNGGFTFDGWFTDDRLPGDVNGDGVINVADALQILRHIVGLSSNINDCEDAFNAARITGEPRPVVVDALQVLRKVVNLPNTVPAPAPVTTDLVITRDMTITAKWTAITPAVPTGVTVITNESSRILLMWRDTQWADGHELMRSNERLGEYSRVATTTGAVVSFADATVRAGTTYYYTVRAFREVDGARIYSDYSAVVEVRAR
jgi:hypothetical protein